MVLSFLSLQKWIFVKYKFRRKSAAANSFSLILISSYLLIQEDLIGVC